jgi:ankyrin repeat protein
MSRIAQELFEATAENNVPEVRRLLSVGADVNSKDYNGITPLHWACIKGHVQVFKELVEHGAVIGATDNDGLTPLHWACIKGRVQVFMELLEHGADIEATHNDGLTALHCAVMQGQLAIVNELLIPSDINGSTTSILGKCKTRGANIEAKDRDGDTPLHFASGRGDLPVLKALLSGGANILDANNNGDLPIHLAVNYRKSAVAKCLLQHIYATTRRLPIHDLLKDLTWTGDPYMNTGAPPLFAALYMSVLGTEDVVEILEYLVGRNPELISSLDQDGSLPLHLACRRGAPFAIVQSLANLYKVAVKSVTPQGDLPLFLACEMSQTSLDSIFFLMKLYPDLVYR